MSLTWSILLEYSPSWLPTFPHDVYLLSLLLLVPVIKDLCTVLDQIVQCLAWVSHQFLSVFSVYLGQIELEIYLLGSSLFPVTLAGHLKDSIPRNDDKGL